MALIDLWNSSRELLESKRVQQVIAIAGDGKLMDGNVASEEFRSFLQQIPTELLTRYANECLNKSFEQSGLALQDIVNEMGRRLGFRILLGRYRGSSNYIGFDGLWRNENVAIVLEVKTTDAYSIHLDTIANYRRDLVERGDIKEESSSILIVVGRDETGDLEAQIRGSRHAWDMRLISVEALVRLLALKEKVDDPNTIKKIHEILIPREFTRLDEIANILFSTAEDIREDDDLKLDGGTGPGVKKPKFMPVAFNDQCVEYIQKHIHKTLLKRSRAIFSSPDNSVGLICKVSKEHLSNDFWFAFHTHQKEFLEACSQGLVAFGCGSAEKIVLIPGADFIPWLDGMHTTDDGKRKYWHVSIFQEGTKLVLHRKKGQPRIDLTGYLIT